MLSTRAARLLAEPPLNKTLRRVFAGATGTRSPSSRKKHPTNINKDPTSKAFSRTEIVSEKLCDDLIEYLGPTLKPYKGCTILDVNPGACLWSRKLHEFLRPKCHILMEPDDLYTEEFIKPLLRKPNSKYRHCKLPFTAASWIYVHPYAQALDAARKQGVRNIPTLSASTREYDDHKLRLLDANLLMTGNLSRIYHKTNPANIIHKELLAALDNSSIHRNGLVRQLWWMPDTYKNKIVMSPQVLTGRNSSSIMTALAANVTQVAGTDLSIATTKESKALTSNPRMRNPHLDAENRRQVNARMHLAGMFIPEGRKILQPPESEAMDSEEVVENVELKNPFTIHYHTYEQVSKAIDDFDKFLDTIRAASSDNWNKSTVLALVQAIEYPQSLPSAIANAVQPHQRNNENATNLAYRKAIYLDTMLRLLSLETHLFVLREQQKIDITPLQSKLSHLDQEITTQLMKPLAETCTTLLEDQQIHFSSPQNFLYDRRTYEPLLTKPTDFWPKAPLTLYDCVPTTTDLDVDSIAPRQEVLKLTRELSKLLYLYKASPLPFALDRIAPNAAQDLIPKVPALTDPRMGGRLDPGKVLMRMVGEGMFEGLVKAWFEWPFKPERYELEIASLGDRGLFGGGGGDVSGGGESGEKKD